MNIQSCHCEARSAEAILFLIASSPAFSGAPRKDKYNLSRVRNDVHGFTFVEVLIAVTIFSILSLAVFSTFSSGMRMWRRVQDTASTQRKVIMEFERFSQDLRMMLNFSDIGFKGEVEKIIFPVLSEGKIAQVTYWLDEGVFTRTVQDYKDILDGGKAAKNKRLLKEVGELKFSFPHKKEGDTEYSWENTWKKGEEPQVYPPLVKINLKINDAEFNKTICLPVS